MIEATFQKDSYNKNTLLKGDRALVAQIYTLCMMKKGTDPLNPNKGVDVDSYRYQFSDDSVIYGLQNEIQEQIRDYTPYLVTNVYCKALKNKKNMMILHIIISLTNSKNNIIISTNGEISKASIVKI